MLIGLATNALNLATCEDRIMRLRSVVVGIA